MSHKRELNSVKSNQPNALEPYNLFTTDPVLKDALRLEGVGTRINDLENFGANLSIICKAHYTSADRVQRPRL